MLKFNVHGLLD